MSRTPASYAMTVVRGSTWEEEFTYTDETTGAAIDLTGYSARMQVRSLTGEYGTTTATTLLLERTTTANPTELFFDTAAQGRLRIKIPPTVHTVLNPTNLRKVKYAYAIEIFVPAGASPEYVIPLVKGKVSVLGEVTR